MGKIFLSLFFVFICLTSSYSAQKIILVTGEWAPYTSEKITGGGFFTEIVTAVFKEAGMEVEYKYYPWLRCESVLKAGKAFAAFPYFKTSAREEIFDFTERIYKTQAKFFYMKNRIAVDYKWDKFEDFKPYTMGGTLGFWYVNDFEKAGLKPEYSNDDITSFRKLKAGMFDFYPTDELVGLWIIKNEFPGEAANFKTVKKPLNIEYLMLMVSRTYPESSIIRGKFNAALKRIREKGIYSTILKKHGMKE